MTIPVNFGVVLTWGGGENAIAAIHFDISHINQSIKRLYLIPHSFKKGTNVFIEHR